ncbi:MAG: hypothetical protein ACI4OP_02265 [Candidatus Coprovivens sp.]
MGMAANKAIKYGRNVYDRYKFVNMPLASTKEISKVLRKYLPYSRTAKGKPYYSETKGK